MSDELTDEISEIDEDVLPPGKNLVCRLGARIEEYKKENASLRERLAAAEGDRNNAIDAFLRSHCRAERAEAVIGKLKEPEGTVWLENYNLMSEIDDLKQRAERAEEETKGWKKQHDDQVRRKRNAVMALTKSRNRIKEELDEAINEGTIILKERHRAEADNAKFREVLEFYAEPMRWRQPGNAQFTMPAILDSGAEARAALKKEGE